jgi:flagellar motility protein MotE (MotC chaperone)
MLSVVGNISKKTGMRLKGILSHHFDRNFEEIVALDQEMNKIDGRSFFRMREIQKESDSKIEEIREERDSKLDELKIVRQAKADEIAKKIVDLAKELAEKENKTLNPFHILLAIGKLEILGDE